MGTELTVIDVGTLQLRHRNAHDVEDVMLCDFLRDHQPEIKNVLDVGAHFSHAHYAPEVRSIIKGAYDAVDILKDEKTAKIVDLYFVGNVIDMPRVMPVTKSCGYDCVFSISALEHCGMTSYKRDNPREERMKVVQRINELAERFIFLTFPFGTSGHVAGQYENITAEELMEWMHVVGGKGSNSFFFNEFPQQGKPWREISGHECAKIPLDPRIDQQTVAICVWEKR